MVPTLSQIQAWSTEPLIEAASYWTKTADQWEDVFLQIRNQSHILLWEGAGGEALRQRTGADVAIVVAKADQLRQASKFARDGAGTIGTAQRRVLYAVEDAHNAGFFVGEDLSVIDTRTSHNAAEQAARQEQAQVFATDIRQRATQLLGADQEVAAKITAATTELTPTFPETHPLDDHIVSDGKDKGGVRLVDQHTFKQDPPAPPGPPGNPFAGWTDEQMRQVAIEIAHGHALEVHPEDFPPGWNEPDLARWIYDTMKDSNTRAATSIDSGALTLLRDGRVILIQPKGGDFGTTFAPRPRPGDSWRTPLDYFEQRTRALDPLPPPVAGRLPPLTPGEMAPRMSAPPPAPPIRGGADLAPMEPPPAARTSMEPPGRLGGPMAGGPVPPESIPHPVQLPHSHHELPVLGKDELPDLDEFGSR